jgi:hypothetical protein
LFVLCETGTFLFLIQLFFAYFFLKSRWSKDEIFEWFKTQTFTSQKFKELFRVKEIVRKREKKRLIPLIIRNISATDANILLAFLKDAELFTRLSEEKKLLPEWLNRAERSEEMLHHIQAGQIIWVKYKPSHGYFQFTLPMLVTIPNVGLKYVAPNLENVATELKKNNLLPDIFRQPSESKYYSAPKTETNKFQLVSLFSLEDEKRVEDRFPEIVHKRLKA